jgi:hypothetical protein
MQNCGTDYGTVGRNCWSRVEFKIFENPQQRFGLDFGGWRESFAFWNYIKYVGRKIGVNAPEIRCLFSENGFSNFLILVA